METKRFAVLKIKYSQTQSGAVNLDAAEMARDAEVAMAEVDSGLIRFRLLQLQYHCI